jgi:hypothetical protein
LAAVSLCGLSACATSSEPVSVGVKDDLSQTVRLRVCKSVDCARTGDEWLLTPGQLSKPTVEVKSGYNSMIVLDSNNQPVGCLPFRFDVRPTSLVTVGVSQAVVCGSHGGAEVAGGKDWPDPSL